MCLFPLCALTRRVAEFGDKNYLGACTQGVFSHKVRKAQSAKAYKGVFCVFVYFKDHVGKYPFKYQISNIKYQISNTTFPSLSTETVTWSPDLILPEMIILEIG